MITGQVLKGERRMRGRQKPFNWAAPIDGLNNKGVDSLLKLHLEAAKCGNLEFQFMIPDLFPPRTDYSNAETFTDTKMELGKFCANFVLRIAPLLLACRRREKKCLI